MFKNDEPRCDKKKKKRSKIGAEAVFSAPKFLVLASLLFQYRKSFFFFLFWLYYKHQGQCPEIVGAQSMNEHM